MRSVDGTMNWKKCGRGGVVAYFMVLFQFLSFSSWGNHKTRQLIIRKKREAERRKNRFRNISHNFSCRGKTVIFLKMLLVQFDLGR
jgi:hypothetical protein